MNERDMNPAAVAFLAVHGVRIPRKPRTSKRSDIHRPGAIIPAHYEYVFSYNGATSDGGWPIPSYGIDCALDRRTFDAEGKIIANGSHDEDGLCCIVGMHAKGLTFVKTGSTCQCSICSTHFVYGDVWKHIPTGEFVHVGHNCSDKYQMLCDRSEWEITNGRMRAAAAVECLKAKKKDDRAAFLAKNPGLEEALKCSHRIVQDIASKFVEFCSLSPKQIALVVKLATEAKLPPRPEEKKVPAPVGRQVIRGVLVSKKSYEGQWGSSIKGTIKVSTPDGIWLAWGTLPDGLWTDVPNGIDTLGVVYHTRSVGPEVGDTIELTGTLTVSDKDPSFAFFKRPSCSSIVSRKGEA